MTRAKIVDDAVMHGILGHPDQFEEVSVDDFLNPNHTSIDEIEGLNLHYPDPFTLLSQAEREQGYPIALDPPILYRR